MKFSRREADMKKGEDTDKILPLRGRFIYGI
jgi:hypothetical protein